MNKWTGDICPKIQHILELTKDQQKFWHVVPCGNNKFEVRKGYDAFKVDEAARTCSCRMWQLLGLPCVHVVACIFKLSKLVEPYVPPCFRAEMFSLAYSQYLSPVGGISFWPDCSHLSKILGPMPKKMPGRTRKKRVRASHEKKSYSKVSKSGIHENNSLSKVYRSGIKMTCHNCGEIGHNKKGCTKDPIPKPPKVKGKAGRPKKSVPNENTNVDDDADLPMFVNNSIDEFSRSPSKNLVFFKDGKVFNLPKVNRGGKTTRTSFVKMRGGKTSMGKFVPAERLGRIERWLGVDATSSDPIENRQPIERSQVATNFNNKDACNLLGTQQSQVVGGHARKRLNPTATTSHNKTVGVKVTKGKSARSAFIRQTISEPPLGDQSFQASSLAVEAPAVAAQQPPPVQPQQRRRQQAQVIPQRERSQRIMLKNFSKPIRGPGSSIDNEIVIE